ncbi:MAG TPA: PilT/PilU family type 4a pilus ATPase [Candidatus Limiplasma sp.]|nr:PilT/PilU family type 4a pilus ATPase [Candidatus Limiplasma sp.]
MNLIDLLKEAIRRDVSDIYIVPGTCIMAKSGGELIPLGDSKIMPDDSIQLIRQVYAFDNHRSMDKVLETGDDDFSFSLSNVGRFRCNAYKQRSSVAAVLRVVPFGLADPKTLHIPDAVLDLYKMQRGLVLVTGPAGSGKSTTLACIIDRINRECSNHIVTIEDPIEHLHYHIKSIVSQREISQDTENYATALRASLRQAPDTILVGEMRDYETIQTVLTAAETGHMVFSTLHTVGAVKTIDRIIDVFPANRQQQVRIQLSMVLSAVVSQQLLPTIDGKLEPAFEIMIVNNAISNMIREGKVHQMDNVIYSGASQGMITMDSDIVRLYHEKKITRETAQRFAVNTDTIAKRLQ